MPRHFRALLYSSFLALAALTPVAPQLAAQQPTQQPTQQPAQQAAPAAAAPTPEIYFRSPADGAVVAPSFDVLFGLRNYGVAPASVNFPRTGHFHVLINVEPPAPGAVIPADSLRRHFGLGQIETKLTLAPGTYTLRLVLADYEHKVIGPELNSRPIRITVRSPR